MILTNLLYLCTQKDKNNTIMATIRETQFSTLAIGATAKRMGITATELHNRLKRHGLVRRLLIDCYDTLHTESIDGVVWNVQEALKNWEAKDQAKTANDANEKGDRQ